MAIAAHPHSTPDGIVTDAAAMVRDLGDVLWSARRDDELVGTAEALVELRAGLAALEACVLDEVAARDLAKESLGWGSTADWYTHLAGLGRGQGKRTVDHARQLVEERPATLAALREGAISPEQAAVVLDGLERLPSRPELRRRAEAALLEEANRLDASELRRAARHLLRVIDPAGEERAEERALDREQRTAHLRRFLSVADDGMGGVRVTGRGSAEDAATLRAALLPLSAPVPTTDPASCAELPDPRDHGARLWDALVATAQHALSTDLAPDCHGARPRVAVTVDLSALRGELGRLAVTEDGTDLPASVVRRLACDADVVPVILGSRSEVLDVGRLQRLVTAALWRALMVRDRHCAFPGCTRPPVMCHAHHVVHWVDGGPTSLDNLVLLCGHHHRYLHASPWQVRINPDDGRPEFKPPPKSGVIPVWVRHRPRRE